MVMGYALLLVAGVYEIVSKDVLCRRKNVAKRAAAYHRRLCYQEADSR